MFLSRDSESISETRQKFASLMVVIGNAGWLQVKDPSKAAHASDADIKDLLQFRGEELKKDSLAEAKPDEKRYEQVCRFYSGLVLKLLYLLAITHLHDHVQNAHPC